MPGKRKNSMFNLNNLPKEYLGIVIRTKDEFGVAIEIADDKDVSEHFNKCRYYTCRLKSEGKDERNYLVLSSTFDDGLYEFASICTEFLEPGENGKNRLNILESPCSWWEKWKELLGNKNSEKSVYSIIAEMSVLKIIFMKDPSVK